jgi:membrane protein implicated in regulation of membrane protease activity
MDYISTFFIVGIILMIIDLIFININILIFLGMSAVIASILHTMGFHLPECSLLVSLVASTGVVTALSTLLLWKPLKSFQNKTSETDTSSDLIGKTLIVSETIELKKNGKVSFSGANWTSKADPDFTLAEDKLLVDSEVVVTKIIGNTLWVKKH